MRVVLVGGKGMLGQDLAVECHKRGWQPLICDLPEVDICKTDSLRQGLPQGDVVLNCAAFTRVDDAEKERDLCMAINGTGAGHVARLCADRGVRLIHLSTDYVFNGRKGTPYVEDDPVDPLSYYGVTKLAGEQEVLASGARATIVRTQSLYGLNGRNFIKAILGQIHKGNRELRVVNDQVSSPTYTRHLAHGLLELVQNTCSGVVHVAAGGHCSWFDFARAIVRMVNAGGVDVLPRPSAELKYPAQRPAFSVLDTTRFRSITGMAMPSWEDGLAEYLKEEPLARLDTIQ